MAPAGGDPHVGIGFEPRQQQLGIALRVNGGPAHQLRIGIDGGNHRLEGGRPSRGVEPAGHFAEFRGWIAHQHRKLAPGAGQRRLEALAVGFHQRGGDLGTAGLSGRGGAGLDAAAQQRRQAVDGGNLLVEDLNAPLRAEHAEEGDRGLRQQLQPDGLALDRGHFDAGDACGNPRIALAEQLEGLADLQRGLGRSRPAIFAGAEGILLFVGQFRVEEGARLDTLARGDADVALGRRQPRACGQRARQRAPHRQSLGVRRRNRESGNQTRRRARQARGHSSEQHQADL